MDVHDVSHVDKFTSVLKIAQENADRAAQRKGETVSSLPSSQSTVTRFMTQMNSAAASAKSNRATILTSLVPSPYSPCVLPVSGLSPIAIKDMKLETHHRGCMALLRIITPPHLLHAIMAIVEDEQGNAVLLQLYNQPEESRVTLEQVISRNQVCIIKEPFLKYSSDGFYSLRVDHPGDIIWVRGDDDLIPSIWKSSSPASAESSTTLRLQGNASIQKGQWKGAELIYSSALATARNPKDKQLAYLNRSLAHLRLGHFQLALEDAVHGTDARSPSEMGLFRQARALYELGRFGSALEKLELLSSSYPDNKAVGQEIQRARERIQEQETGIYQFRAMYKQAMKTPPLIDCATYTKPIEIRPSPGQGNGLFTKRAVSAGELLLCEKAFAYTFADESTGSQDLLMNMATKRITQGGQVKLLSQVIQKVHHNREMWKLFTALHQGSDISDDGYPVVDSFLVERIIALNSFGAPRSSRGFHFVRSTADKTQGSGGPMVAHSTTGSWLMASRFNHSCIPNCHRSFIGDVQIVRAMRDLPADTELFFSYQNVKAMEPYEETQKRLRNWGFECSCELCLAKKSTDAETFKIRKSLYNQLEPLMRNSTYRGYQLDEVSLVEQILKKIEITYQDSESGSVTRQALGEPYIGLGATYLSDRRPVDAVRATVQGLEALGFSLTAYSVTGGDQRLQLEVKRWGRVNNLVPWAFLNLHQAYKLFAPELCIAAWNYVTTAYSIIVGEGETAADTFQNLV